MTNTKSYVDLNIPIGPQCEQICEAAIKLGYRILGINTPVLAKTISESSNGGGSSGTASGSTSSKKKAGKKRKWVERSGGVLASTVGKLSSVPEPLSTTPWISKLIEKSTSISDPVRILQRLTIIFEDIKDLQTVLNHVNTRKYDILAVIPTSSDALVSCITNNSVNFDIITFDFEGPYWIQKLKINRVKGNLAAQKDIVFEINYAAALAGDAALENLIYITHNLIEEVCVKRIKNLIISSGASSPIQLRSPKDATGLAFLTGLDETTTRHCLREYAHRVVSVADSRQYGKTSVAFIPNKPELPQPNIEADVIP